MVTMRASATPWIKSTLLGCAVSALLLGPALASDQRGAASLASAGSESASTDQPVTEELTRPSTVQAMDPELAKILDSYGLPGASVVIVLQPSDKITVLVPDPNAGQDFAMPEDEKVALPDPVTHSAQPKDFKDLIIVRSASPAVVTVCKKISGAKVCWQETSP